MALINDDQAAGLVIGYFIGSILTLLLMKMEGFFRDKKY